MPEFDWKHDPLSESLRAFKARMQLYLEDQAVTDLAKQATKIKIAIGDEGMRRLLSSGLTDAQLKIPANIWTLLSDQLDVRVHTSYRVHCLEFTYVMTQGENESISDYVSRLREKASLCDFGADELTERILEKVIYCTPFEDLKKDLLAKPKGYSVANALTKGREYEALKASNTSLKNMGAPSAATATNIDAVRQKRPCGNCGRHHPPRRCPAYLSTCSHCGAKGHWKDCCRKLKTERRAKHQKNDYKKPNY